MKKISSLLLPQSYQRLMKGRPAGIPWEVPCLATVFPVPTSNGTLRLARREKNYRTTKMQTTMFLPPFFVKLTEIVQLAILGLAPPLNRQKNLFLWCSFSDYIYGILFPDIVGTYRLPLPTNLQITSHASHKKNYNCKIFPFTHITITKLKKCTFLPEWVSQ